MSAWFRWRIGARWSVWHRSAPLPHSGHSLISVGPKAVVVIRRGVHLHLELEERRTLCGVPLPKLAQMQDWRLEGAPEPRCLWCLRVWMASGLPPLGSPATARRRGAKRTGTRLGEDAQAEVGLSRR
jgi:hypothetical protein